MRNKLVDGASTGVQFLILMVIIFALVEWFG